MPETVDTNAKALQINLDPAPYGTFAEIGGGQEVSRWFFRVGGAAGTVAKTISAYDMTVSDAIYGTGERYVSRERLRSMLDHEFTLLRERLSASRGDKTAFFTFADTVATRNFKGTNESHGWIGLRMQHAPGAAPSDILVHVRLGDPTAAHQQKSLGVFGVNLIYGAFYRRETRAGLLKSLLDGLTLDNIEVDVVECSGPAFPLLLDRNALTVDLLGQGLASGVVFDVNGRMDEPTSVLRKRGLVVHRSSMRGENPELDRMIAASVQMLKAESPGAEHEPLPVLELSLAGMPSAKSDGTNDAAPNPAERIDALVRPGHGVIVTSYLENFRIANYLRRHNQESIRFAAGLDSIVSMLREQFYTNVDGGMLEALGRLFGANIKGYIFDMPAGLFRERIGRHGIDSTFCRTPEKPVLTLADVKLAPPAGHLLEFLRDAGWIVGARLTAK